MEQVLYPIHHGIFNFVGFEVIEPFVVYCPSRISHEERQRSLEAFKQRLLSLASAHSGHEASLRTGRLSRICIGRLVDDSPQPGDEGS